MTEEESVSIYDELAKVLRQSQLAWVTDQVDELIRFGKPKTKQVRTLKENPRQSSFLVGSTGPKADLEATEEYTPQESLLLLIDAAEQVAVNTAEMEYITVSHLAGFEDNRPATDIVFVPEQANERELLISQQQAARRNHLAQQLKQLLQELRANIYAH